MIPKVLIEQSITSAVKQDWHLAVDINLEILQYDPYHIPTLNRLAKAYRETNQLKKAKRTYEQTLQYDKYNSIAQKNLSLLNNWLANSKQNHQNGKKYNTDFIDEPGVTKTIPLVRLGDPQLISTLEPGQVVILSTKNHMICITTHNNDHIGALTDDVAFHLKQYIHSGYLYQSMIKSANNKIVLVFIKETHRPESCLNKPTFCF